MTNNLVQNNYIYYTIQQIQSIVPFNSNNTESFGINSTLCFDFNNVIYRHEAIISNIHQNQSNISFDEVVEIHDERRIHTRRILSILSFYNRQLVNNGQGIFSYNLSKYLSPFLEICFLEI
jgi:hypothetical protein